MVDGLDELAMQVAALRTECSYVLDALAELERAAHRSSATNAQHQEISRLNHDFPRDVEEELRAAADQLRDWASQIALALASEERQL